MTTPPPPGSSTPAEDLTELASVLDEAALRHNFSGAISIDVDGSPVLSRGYGLAERVLRIPNTPETRFGVASVSKAFTALVIMSLIEDGSLSRTSRVRPMLGLDLPGIDDDVTLEHLLGHTSGLGDYLDESADWEVTDYVLPVPTHTLAETEGFLQVLHCPQVSRPGERFAYNNGGYIVLALAAERACGRSFHELVTERVLAPAGMGATGYPRLDEPAAGTATGYLRCDSVRTNVLHLPVRGNGDGGAVSTVEDLSRFWRALADGRIVSRGALAEMTRPRHHDEYEGLRCGMGFWLDEDGPGWILEGYDPGVSVRTRFDPTTRTTVTIVSNDSEGAWPVIQRYVDWLNPSGSWI
ncbi:MULTISPECIES: serine hydrolase domain-containing protein [Citricoccus]|uniref:serine hydrolase domain-containing protein n=1 Tax=Citricoccus TaxID=169133 RepID=UPI000255EFF0|nr:serine hydrolase domain-containing protein [Citricoccus sp. CH26A]